MHNDGAAQLQALQHHIGRLPCRSGNANSAAGIHNGKVYDRVGLRS